MVRKYKNSNMITINSAPKSLPIVEAFYTLQGEGAFQGQAAYFIRLAGCDVGCVWCDVKESWEEENHPMRSISEIVEDASKFPCRKVVITGGEPLMHNLNELTKELHKASFSVHIETSGTHPLSGNLDWICFSPKKFKKPLPEIYAKADELKVIVFNQSDFGFAESFAKEMRTDCKLLLQPEWSKSEKMVPQIIEYVKANPKWQVSLQTHKYMDIP